MVYDRHSDCLELVQAEDSKGHNQVDSQVEVLSGYQGVEHLVEGSQVEVTLVEVQNNLLASLGVVLMLNLGVFLVLYTAFFLLLLEWDHPQVHQVAWNL